MKLILKDGKQKGFRHPQSDSLIFKMLVSVLGFKIHCNLNIPILNISSDQTDVEPLIEITR